MNSTARLSPIAFGADPSGQQDSTAAFKAMHAAMMSRGEKLPRLAENITNLGGVVIDLEGGEYLISEPFVFPQMTGNAQVVRGSLLASAKFPSDQYLIHIGDTTCPNQQKSCNMNIEVSGVLFDGGQAAAGGVWVGATMGTSLGPMNYYTGHTQAGVYVTGGHETMIHESWVGQFFWGSPQKEGPTMDSNGIEIRGNDHFLNEVIVFDGKVGVYVLGAANLFEGVHTWNDATAHGGKGIVLDNGYSGQNRLIGCYLDFTDLRIFDPSDTIVTDGFFLGGGRIELVPGDASTAKGLYASGNVFQTSEGTGFDTVIVNRTAAGPAFKNVVDVTIEGSVVQQGGSWNSVSTTASKAVVVSTATDSVSIDFTDALLFTPSEAPIQSVQYSLALDGDQLATSSARLPGSASHVVKIDMDGAHTGVVTVTVDQSKRTH